MKNVYPHTKRAVDAGPKRAARSGVGVYLDYAASTPVDPRVWKTMQPYFAEEFGNPGSLHAYGQKAIAAVDQAREILANILGADFREVIFTGSATEANNLALRGATAAARKKIKKPQLIISAIEHESVLLTARALEKEGVEVTYLPVGKDGVVSLAALRRALTPETALVSIMYVNNETGAVEPVSEIAKIIRELRGRNTYPLLHTDAAQAFYLLDCRPEHLGADLLTLSAHKICGPKGIGALYVRKGTILRPLTTGGGQEFGLRSGTENVAAIAGFGRAAELAAAERAPNLRHIESVREMFIAGLRKIFPKVEINAPGAPHILNMWLPGHKAEDAVMKLDRLGIAVSAGPACKARTLEPSHVLEAMGFPIRRVEESIRVSFGRATSAEDTKKALAAARSVLRQD